MTGFKDHFSAHAAEYSQFRPHYPPEIFEYLAGLSPSRQLAWDVGCGNGQAAIELARHFEKVIATDASAQQLQNATPHAKVEYRQVPAEHSGLEAGSMDLIVAAQSLHWFDFEAFFAEVRRVAGPEGIFAALTYGKHSVDAAIDRVLDRFRGEVETYWPLERAHVEAAYRTIPIPFAEIESPPFSLVVDWPLAGYFGYLSTWSSTKAFIKKNQFDPVAKLADDFVKVWGDPDDMRPVRWDLHLRVSRVN